MKKNNSRTKKLKGQGELYVKSFFNRNIGSRTGKDVRSGRNIERDKDGFENFDAYWSESDADTTNTSVSHRELMVKHQDHQLQQAVKNVNSSSFQSASSYTTSSMGAFYLGNRAIGSRTGKNIIAGKRIRKGDDGFDKFDDYWTESESESILSFHRSMHANNSVSADVLQEDKENSVSEEDSEVVIQKPAKSRISNVTSSSRERDTQNVDKSSVSGVILQDHNGCRISDSEDSTFQEQMEEGGPSEEPFNGDTSSQSQVSEKQSDSPLVGGKASDCGADKSQSSENEDDPGSPLQLEVDSSSENTEEGRPLEQSSQSACTESSSEDITGTVIKRPSLAGRLDQTPQEVIAEEEEPEKSAPGKISGHQVSVDEVCPESHDYETNVESNLEIQSSEQIQEDDDVSREDPWKQAGRQSGRKSAQKKTGQTKSAADDMEEEQSVQIVRRSSRRTRSQGRQIEQNKAKDDVSESDTRERGSERGRTRGSSCSENTDKTFNTFIHNRSEKQVSSCSKDGDRTINTSTRNRNKGRRKGSRSCEDGEKTFNTSTQNRSRTGKQASSIYKDGDRTFNNSTQNRSKGEKKGSHCSEDGEKSFNASAQNLSRTGKQASSCSKDGEKTFSTSTQNLSRTGIQASSCQKNGERTFNASTRDLSRTGKQDPSCLKDSGNTLNDSAPNLSRTGKQASSCQKNGDRTFNTSTRNRSRSKSTEAKDLEEGCVKSETSSVLFRSSDDDQEKATVQNKRGRKKKSITSLSDAGSVLDKTSRESADESVNRAEKKTIKAGKKLHPKLILDNESEADFSLDEASSPLKKPKVDEMFSDVPERSLHDRESPVPESSVTSSQVTNTSGENNHDDEKTDIVKVKLKAVKSTKKRALSDKHKEVSLGRSQKQDDHFHTSEDIDSHAAGNTFSKSERHSQSVDIQGNKSLEFSAVEDAGERDVDFCQEDMAEVDSSPQTFGQPETVTQNLNDVHHKKDEDPSPKSVQSTGDVVTLTGCEENQSSKSSSKNCSGSRVTEKIATPTCDKVVPKRKSGNLDGLDIYGDATGSISKNTDVTTTGKVVSNTPMNSFRTKKRLSYSRLLNDSAENSVKSSETSVSSKPLSPVEQPACLESIIEEEHNEESDDDNSAVFLSLQPSTHCPVSHLNYADQDSVDEFWILSDDDLKTDIQKTKAGKTEKRKSQTRSKSKSGDQNSQNAKKKMLAKSEGKLQAKRKVTKRNKSVGTALDRSQVQNDQQVLAGEAKGRKKLRDDTEDIGHEDAACEVDSGSEEKTSTTGATTRKLNSSHHGSSAKSRKRKSSKGRISLVGTGVKKTKSAKVTKSKELIKGTRKMSKINTPLRKLSFANLSLYGASPRSGVSFRRQRRTSQSNEEAGNLTCPAEMSCTPTSGRSNKTKKVSKKRLSSGRVLLEGPPIVNLTPLLGTEATGTPRSENLTPILVLPGSVKSIEKKKRRVTINNIIEKASVSYSDSSNEGATPALSTRNQTNASWADITGSPVHIFETTNTEHEPVTKPPETKIIYPKPAPDGVRRSQRTRLKPLEWFKNEHVIYQRRKSGTFEIAGVHPSQEAELLAAEAERRMKRNARWKLKHKKITGKTRDRLISKQNLSMHTELSPNMDFTVSNELPVVNPDTGDEVLVDCFAQVDSSIFVGPKGDGPSENDPYIICHAIQQHSFTAGHLLIAPLAEKPLQMLEDNTLIFTILTGKLSVTIHRGSTVLEEGDQFFIPRGNAYKLKNLRNEEAKLSFVNLLEENCES